MADTQELKRELEKRFPWLLDPPNENPARAAWELRAIFTIDGLIKWYRSL